MDRMKYSLEKRVPIFSTVAIEKVGGHRHNLPQLISMVFPSANTNGRGIGFGRFES